MKEPDFGQGAFLTFWNSLTAEQREELIANLNEFHALISGLRGQGIISTDKNITEITIYKKNEDTKRLLELKAKINAPGIKVVYKRG